MRALLIEDDSEQFQAVSKRLEAAFTNIEIKRISTESEFYRRFEEIVSDPPDVIVIDVMVRWTDASSAYVPMPPEIRADNGHYRAGFRCAKMLAEDKRSRTLPMIIYSVLDEADLQAQIARLGISLPFIRKESYIHNLADEIKSILRDTWRR